LAIPAIIKRYLSNYQVIVKEKRDAQLCLIFTL